MSREYKPLSDDELRDMHNTLRDQFEHAGAAVKAWKRGWGRRATPEGCTGRDFADGVNSFTMIAPVIDAQAQMIEAMISVDRELERREEQRRDPVPLKKPQPPRR